MQHTPGTLPAHDGLALFTRRWWPDREARAVVLLVHGIGEHSGRYAYPAAHLLLHDVAVLAYDHRGHGQSEGLRTYVDDFEEYVSDLALVHEWAEREAGDLPFFLMGHSLGGLIVARYLVDRRPEGLRGVILSSPALQIPSDLSPLLQRLSGVLSRLVPRLRLTRLDLTHLSRDPRVRRAYEEDPLTDKKGVRARLGAEVLETTRLVRQHPEAFTAPLLLFHGTADRITDPDGSRWLHTNAPSEDKTLRLYEGLYHETMNEPEREQVLDDLVAWIHARAAPPS
ncbi:MAG: alpha/beta hydrolase [Rubricoccaceae bacterium]|nr:alpha/beta hydrolase [Rubricoccaceae bacterium]